MNPELREHLRKWPGPNSGRQGRDAYIAWLKGYPAHRSMEGPEREWALRQGGKWRVDEYRTASFPTLIGTTFTSAELYDRWTKTGLGILAARPSLTTRELHALLTGTV